MLYIPKIDAYLKIFTDEEVEDFVAINFSESIKREQNLSKVHKSLYFFLTTSDELQANSSDNFIHHYHVKTLNLFDPELQLINSKPVIKNKLKGLLNKFKTVLVLDYKKRNGSQIFHLQAKIIAVNFDIHEAFESMHQTIITKIKN